MAKIEIIGANRFPELANASNAAVKALSEREGEYFLFPGFCDVHVHLREPGFSYKETIATGTEAALRGGYTAVCAMPNLNPVPDCLETLRPEMEIIEQTARVPVYPYGAITRGEKGEQLADMAAMAEYVCAFGGYIHDGQYPRAPGHRGICSESVWRQIERDVALAAETGCKYHVCHISCKESVRIIREAKQSRVDVTCETGPHYLLMDENDLREEGRFKMNPPLRAREDREALLEGLCDGTIDMIATDHAPHSAQEKSKGLAGSAFGIVGLETAFPLLYTYLVRGGVVSLEKLVELMAISPRHRFALPFNGIAAWNLNRETAVDPSRFASMGRATPFEGWKVLGERAATIL